MGEEPKLQILQRYITREWPLTKEVVELGVEIYLLIRHELAMTHGVVMKGKCIITPFLLQKQILEKLCSNHIGIEKIDMLTRESV